MKVKPVGVYKGLRKYVHGHYSNGEYVIDKVVITAIPVRYSKKSPCMS